MTLRIMGLYLFFSITTFSIITLPLCSDSCFISYYAKCHNDECCYADCLFAKCRYTRVILLIVEALLRVQSHKGLHLGRLIEVPTLIRQTLK
jgi:hypothetical protein